jgi:predicted HD superfamily hydrolase involved in NAD metabolism
VQRRRVAFDSLKREVEGMPAGLRRHIEGVVGEARRLARLHGVDEERAALAALGHDVARAVPPSDLPRVAAEHGLEPSEIERAEPILLHGPVGALILAGRYGIEDEDVLAAARYHTTGRAGMSPVEKVVFVADKIEEGKVREQPELAAVRQAAERDLDEAILAYLDVHTARAVRRGWPLHPDAVAARNELLLARGGSRARH